MRVAVYTRLSNDRQGQSTGIDRQLESCRQYAGARGWTITGEFSDSDLSAFRRGVTRPGYEDMLSRLDEFDAILVWKLDRIVRRFLEFARIWPMFDEHKVALVSVNESIDTSTGVGRIILLMLVGFAELESENISLRQRAKHAEIARQGKPAGGGRRGFGHTYDRLAIIPEEAARIQEAAANIIAGQTLYGICQEWKRAGIVSTTGGVWHPSHLRRMFLSPRLIGRRSGDGPVAMAPILDETTWRTVGSIISAPERFRSGGFTARRWLLSGFLVCGKCQSSMKTKWKGGPKGKPPVRRYACDGCFGVMISAEPLEEMLVDGVLHLIDNSAIPEDEIPNHAGLLAQQRADEQAMVDLTRSRYVDRALTDAEFLPARAELIARIEHTKRRLSRTSTDVLHQAKGKARRVWDSAGLQKRRVILGSVLDRVVVNPATRYGPGFDPTRVDPQWRF